MSLEVVHLEPSNQKAKIVTLLGGRSQKGIKLDVYRYSLGSGKESAPLVSLTSDDDGTVITPVLPIGEYHFVAAGEHNLRADLYLDIPMKSGDGISSFSMELFDTYPTMDQKWAAADELPVNDRLGTFNGTIHDFSGAMVPGVKIEVVNKGTSGKQRITEITSAPDGRFSAQLPEGVYIALFSIDGFRSVFTPFEIAKQSSGHLSILLQLGKVSEIVTVTSMERSTSGIGRSGMTLSRGLTTPKRIDISKILILGSGPIVGRDLKRQFQCAL